MVPPDRSVVPGTTEAILPLTHGGNASIVETCRLVTGRSAQKLASTS